MRVIVSILFSLLILFTSNSWHVVIHYCHDEVTDISFNHDNTSKCGDNNGGDCGKCCDDAHIEFESEQSYINADYFVTAPIIFNNQISKFLYDYSHFIEEASTILVGSNSSPPQRKIYLQNCSLVLYG